MLRTIIVDEQVLFSEGLKLLLEKYSEHGLIFPEVSFKDILEDVTILEPHILFIEIGADRQEQYKKIRRIRKQYKNIKIIALSLFDHSKIVRETFQKGIDAYVSKLADITEVLKALDEVLSGNTYLSEGLRLSPEYGKKEKKAGVLNNNNDELPVNQNLTKRESEVLSLIIMAKSNKEIGNTLFISEQTVGVHKKNIMRKLGVHNTVSLIRYAIDNNIV